MSEDLIKQIQELISSGRDVKRLQSILTTLLSGKELDDSDEKYLQTLLSKPVESTGFQLPEGEPSTLELNDPSNLNEGATFDEKTPIEIKPKHNRKKIVIIAGIVAAIIVFYIGSDMYTITALQFRPHKGNQQIISPTEEFVQAEACNPSYFPASFGSYEITAFYHSKNVETLTVNGTTISPKSSTVLNGIFNLNKSTIIEISKQNTTFDPTQAQITTKVNAPLFGVIPFSVNKEYSSQDFANVLKNGPPGGYKC